MDIDLKNDDYEFEVYDNGTLRISLIRSGEIMGKLDLGLNDNDLMGLLNIIKDYFKVRD